MQVVQIQQDVPKQQVDMSGQLVDCFFKYKRLYEEERKLLYLVYMENIARRIGGGFYSWWRRVAPDYAEWWGTCDVDWVSCEDLVRVAVACWPLRVKRKLFKKCSVKELILLLSGSYVC